jgi:hypothetical protein
MSGRGSYSGGAGVRTALIARFIEVGPRLFRKGGHERAEHTLALFMSGQSFPIF